MNRLILLNLPFAIDTIVPLQSDDETQGAVNITKISRKSYLSMGPLEDASQGALPFCSSAPHAN